MCRLAKQKSNKAKSSKLFPLAKVYLRETYKLQNINHISPTPKFTMGIIQIIVKIILKGTATLIIPMFYMKDLNKP